MKKHILLLLILTLISTSLSAQKQELLDLTGRNLRWIDGKLERIAEDNKLDLAKIKINNTEINNEKVVKQYNSKDVLEYLNYLTLFQRTENQINLLNIYPGNKTPKNAQSYLDLLSTLSISFFPKKVYFAEGELTLTDDLLFDNDTIIDNIKQSHYIFGQGYGNHFILDKNKVIEKIYFDVIFHKKVQKEYVLNSNKRIAKTNYGIVSYDTIVSNRISLDLNNKILGYLKIKAKTKQGKIVFATGKECFDRETQIGIDYFENVKVFFQKVRKMIVNDEISSKDEYIKYVKSNVSNYNRKKMMKTKCIFNFPEPVESYIILVDEEKNIKLNKTFQVHIN